ncbi:hypothetical protein M3650_28740 [Paenibacillus sp. MER TA 81-3]|uniref:hypothetical protein n=1 Tax=Paenibacillus sp. MER TA 81-3 TaxID=2939573 RepID=UPI0020408172|nr:hypothetical protein [Paenibacillus sp. MER TA 81-3]MCM3342504.1 hypothetical protein [Paenibacillus sp. MER TA 81-3]
MGVFDVLKSKDGRELPFDPAVLSREYSIDIQEVVHSMLDYDEKRDADEAVYRILNTEEIIELRGIFEELECHQSICPLLTDDQSNYIGVYYTGPLEGKVCFLNHEETNLSPGFRSMERFITKILQDPAAEWDELQHDYPALTDHDDESQQDIKVIADLDNLIMQENLDEDAKQQLIFSKLAIMPCSRMEHICEYLLADDMYVQEKAIEMIRKRKYTPAAGHLFEVAKNGMHNGKVSAILALKEFKTAESKQLLKELKTVLPASYMMYMN